MFEVNPNSPLCMDWIDISAIGKKVTHRVDVRNIYDDLLYSDTTSSGHLDISRERVGNEKEILLEVYDLDSKQHQRIFHGLRLASNSRVYLECGTHTAIDDLVAGFALESWRVNEGALLFYRKAREKANGNMALLKVLDVCEQRLKR